MPVTNKNEDPKDSNRPLFGHIPLSSIKDQDTSDVNDRTRSQSLSNKINEKFFDLGNFKNKLRSPSELLQEFKRQINEPKRYGFADTAQKKSKPKVDIDKIPTYAGRGLAIQKRIDAIQRDKKYQALTPEQQTKVREDFYTKHVPFAYKDFHLPVPDKDTWVGATGRVKPFGSKEQAARDFNLSSAKQFGYGLNVGVDKAYQGIKMFGARITNAQFMGMHDLLRHFSGMDFAPEAVKKTDDYVTNFVERKVNNYVDAQKAKIQDDDFWIQTHPARTTIGKLGSMSGETLATLPLYEAMGTEKLGATVGLPLTAKLMKSPIGKWAASRLINAADGFTSSLVTNGGSVKDASKDAAGFAIGGAIAEPIGKGVKVAAAPLIKKFMAGVISMGGKPLMETLVHSAAHEEEQAMAHADSLGMPSTGEALEQIKRAHEIQDFMKDTRTQAVRNWYAEQQLRSIEDPVNHKLHLAAKQSLGSISMQMFNKPLRGISQNQRKLVRDKALELTGEAADEAPVHLPDLLRNDIQAQVEKETKALPHLAAFDTLLAKNGVSVTDAVAEDMSKDVARRTGISNKNAATKKVIKAAKESSRTFASLSAPYSNPEMRSPRNRTAFEKAIGTKAKGNFGHFYEQLKDADKRGVKFESPIQRLLFAYNNRKALPKDIADKLLYRIRQVKDYKQMSPAQIAEKADWVHTHLTDMAISGHFNKAESNMYGSTKIGDPTKGTKYQYQMKVEADKAQVEHISNSLKNQPKALRAFGASVRAIQKQYTNFSSPEQYLEYRKRLDELVKDTLPKLKKR